MEKEKFLKESGFNELDAVQLAKIENGAVVTLSKGKKPIVLGQGRSNFWKWFYRSSTVIAVVLFVLLINEGLGILSRGKKSLIFGLKYN